MTDAPPHAQISLTSRPVSISVTTLESDEDAEHRRRKDLILFVAALVFVALLALAAAWGAFGSDDAKRREWGMGVLLLIVGGCVGFLTGKGSK